MSKLRDIRLLAARKRDGAKPSKRVIPKELAIFAGRANKGIYGAFGNATFGQLATLGCRSPGKRMVSIFSDTEGKAWTQGEMAMAIFQRLIHPQECPSNAGMPQNSVFETEGWRFEPVRARHYFQSFAAQAVDLAYAATRAGARP